MIQKLRSQHPYTLMFLFAVLFFVLMNPYQGIVGDANLYLLQAVHSVFPERFTGDIMFMYGGQDQFSIFSPVYAAFLKCFGIEYGSMALAAVLMLLNGFALALLIRNVCSALGEKRLLVPAMIFILFTYGEYASVVTGTFPIFAAQPLARHLSEFFCLLGLALFGKKWLSISLIVIGMLFNPLMAGWGVPVWFFYHFPKLRKIVVVLSALFPLSILFNRIPFSRMDDFWQQGNGFGTNYDNVVDLSRWLVGGILLYAAYRERRLPDLLQKLIPAILIAGGIALYWTISGSFIHHVFLMQVQAVRFEWLLSISAKLAFCALLVFYVKDVKESGTLYSRHVGLALLAVTLSHPEWFVLGWIGGALLLLPDRKIPVSWKKTVLILAELGFVAFYIGAMLYDYSVTNKVAMPLLLDKSQLAVAIPLASTIAEICFFFCLVLYFRKTGQARSLLLSKNALLVIFALAALCPESIALGVAFALLLAPEFFLKTPKIKMLAILVGCFLAFDAVSSSFVFSRFVTIRDVAENMVILCAMCYAIYALNAENLKPCGKYQNIIWAVLVLGVGILLCLFWDVRSENRIASEKQMEVFWTKPLFPQIKESGRVFYAVDGPKKKLSRVQFLTGTYVDYNSDAGSLFHREQFVAYQHRALWTKCGAKVEKDCGTGSFGGFMDNGLGLPGMLQSRVDLLCGANEIDYVVTNDASLPYAQVAKDSLEYLQEPVYLYRCGVKIKSEPKGT
ncbi:MAG: hypothetical protein WCT05_13015 [Lentisphaeria bacterium]